MLKPLNGRIILKAPEASKTTQAGIVINIGKSIETVATVVAVSNLVNAKGEIIHSQLNVGDEVVFDVTKSTEHIYNGVKYLIIKEQDILAVIEGEIN